MEEKKEKCAICMMRGFEQDAEMYMMLGCIRIPYCKMHYGCVRSVLIDGKKWRTKTTDTGLMEEVY